MYETNRLRLIGIPRHIMKRLGLSPMKLLEDQRHHSDHQRLEFLQQIVAGLPDDLRVEHGPSFEINRICLCFIVSSSAFSEVHDGDVIPELPVKFRCESEEAPEPESKQTNFREWT
jgi:hypothetical protein